LLDSAVTLQITGIVCPKEDAANASISTVIGYTSALTDHVIDYSSRSAVVTAQADTPTVNVLNGVDFEAPTDEKKVADVSAYISAMSDADKASLFTMIQYFTAPSPQEAANAGAYPQQAMPMDESTMAMAMDHWLAETPDQEILLSLYDEYIGDVSYEENMEAFGSVSYDAPASISIYTDSFEDKEAVADCISRYNEAATEDNRITYVDYVQLMTSSLTSIIDVISYVLIAFVSVSLVVSCIMIGIITHISVLERTKEIGILRALGASKNNIAHVFNAETLIIGFCSGVLGVAITMFLTVPINALLADLLDVANMSTHLPLGAAVILVVISMIITVIGGLMPAGKAAKMDPVIALRTE
jgi:putative ABC transport system permease protein